jgi:putative membrane protein
MKDERPRPRAFRLDEAGLVAPAEDVFIEPPSTAAFEPAEPSLAPEEQAIEEAQREGMLARFAPSLGTLFWSALGGLVSLGIGLWVTRLIEDLFAQAQALGWLAAALAGIALLALFALALREIFAVSRQTRIAKLHADLARAHASDDRDAARRDVARLAALYAGRPESAAGRAEVARASREIIDGRDLIDIAECVLLRSLDSRAQGEIAAAAKRVSVVTAISPRAVLDVLFVIAQIIRLIRRISEIYGGRPGFLGFFKLARSVAAHIAITGGMAVGDSLLQQVVGHGIASKLSARLGEGVLNGLLTARVGLSALAVCRPAPFNAEKQPGVSDVAPFLFGAGKPQ